MKHTNLNANKKSKMHEKLHKKCQKSIKNTNSQ